MKYFIGVDIGLTNVRVGICNNKFKIIKRISEDSLYHKGENLVHQTIRMIESVSNDLTLTGIGIGFAGLFDSKRGWITHESLKKKIQIAQPIEKRFGLRPKFLNDCDAAVIAEKVLGAGKNFDDLIYLTLSSGIGCGVLSDGKLVLGKNWNATEVGHMVIDMTGNLTCGCGKRGHWEAYCSGKKIPNLAKFLASKYINGEYSNNFNTTQMIFDSAKRGDKFSLKVVEEVGRLNAIGISNIVNIFDPSLVTIGGSIALKNEKLVIDPIRRHVREYSVNKMPKIKITPLGEDIVILGAMLTGANIHRNFISRP